MRERIRSAFSREVTMPRWAIVLDFFYRCFILVGACVVIALWWQAATRDEEADRNARIQSCSSGYAATYSAWDAETGRLLARLVADSVSGDPDPEVIADYRQAGSNAAEMARLRIGLASYAAASVEDGGDEFTCPPIPDRLVVEGVEP